MDESMQIISGDLKNCWPFFEEQGFPMAALSNAWALKIHGQDLGKLSERGGMSVPELLMNLERVSHQDINDRFKRDYEEMQKRLMHHIRVHQRREGSLIAKEVRAATSAAQSFYLITVFDLEKNCKKTFAMIFKSESPFSCAPEYMVSAFLDNEEEWLSLLRPHMETHQLTLIAAEQIDRVLI